jgi:uncharacterized protein (TIGR03067 family)
MSRSTISIFVSSITFLFSARTYPGACNQPPTITNAASSASSYLTILRDRGYEDIPIFIDAAHAYVQIVVGEQTFVFAIDTGTPRTVLDRLAAQTLKLKTTNVQQIPFPLGVDNSVSVAFTGSCELTLGRVPCRLDRIHILDLTTKQRYSPYIHYDGLLGLDILRRLEAIIDFRHSKLFLRPLSKEVDLLSGSWQCTASTTHGIADQVETLWRTRLKVNMYTFELENGRESKKYAYQVNNLCYPPSIDLTSNSSAGTIHGIYQLTDGEMLYCWPTVRATADKRPKEFAALLGNQLLSFRRMKTPSDELSLHFKRGPSDMLGTWLSSQGYNESPILIEEDGYPKVSTLVNGMKSMFILDTGSPYTMVDGSVFRKQSMELRQGQELTFQGGPVSISEAYLRLIEWGSAVGRDVAVKVIEMGRMNKVLVDNYRATSVQGILGWDRLRAHQAIVDCYQRRLYLLPIGR